MTIFLDITQHCLTIGTISYHSLVDSFKDCYYGEDESYLDCRQLNDSNRFIFPSNSIMCFPVVALDILAGNYPRSEDELSFNKRSYIQQTSFSYFCNNQREPVSYSISLVDEDNGDLWPCNISYVRCDRKWNCLNGINELNCPDNKCLTNEHECLFKNKMEFICLSIEHLYDKYLDNCPLFDSINRKVYFNKSN